MNNVVFTIFTPTYNRGRLLKRVYNSLLLQDFNSFEWLIIDDGSNDETFKVVESFIEEGHISIRYYTQVNSGKYVAFNRGIALALGDIFICLDSDDFLEPTALSVLNKYYCQYKETDSVAGFSCNNSDVTGVLIGTALPDGLIASHYDLYHKYKVKGDKGLIYKTEILRKYPFPFFHHEKFITEALILNRISQQYSLVCINQSLMRIEYLQSGLSGDYSKLCLNSPNAYYLYLNELGLFHQPFNDYLMNYARFVKFGLICKKSFENMRQDWLDKRWYYPISFVLGAVMYLKLLCSK